MATEILLGLHNMWTQINGWLPSELCYVLWNKQDSSWGWNHGWVSKFNNIIYCWNSSVAWKRYNQWCLSAWDPRRIYLSAIKSKWGGLKSLLDYQFIQCQFRKPSLGCISEVLRATLFKRNLLYSAQRIPGGSPPNISRKGDGLAVIGLMKISICT